MHFGQPGNITHDQILDARLGRRRDRHGVTVTAQPRRHPNDMNFLNRRLTMREGFVCCYHRFFLLASAARAHLYPVAPVFFSLLTHIVKNHEVTKGISSHFTDAEIAPHFRDHRDKRNDGDKHDHAQQDPPTKFRCIHRHLTSNSDMERSLVLSL